MPDAAFERRTDKFAEVPKLGRVCRLGLATRGNTGLSADGVLEAIDRGVNYLNWCGHTDGMREAIRELGVRREDVKIAIQFEARTADDARRELDIVCEELQTDYVDVATYYYVEHSVEWREILGRDGAAEVLEQARAEGRVRAIGLTSHQRLLAAETAASGRLDLLMIRYNAAHRGAEQDIFPVTQARGVAVVAFTGMRWGALLRSTPDDPADYRPPPAADWYRFVLAHPGVSVALTAPDSLAELRENLEILNDTRNLSDEEYARLVAHGDRVRKHAGSFP